MSQQLNQYIKDYNIGNLKISKGGNFQDFLNKLIDYYKGLNKLRIVKKTGEDSGFCIEFYTCLITGRVYGKLEEFKGVFNWYSVTSDGEPIAKINKDIKFKVVV